jgi:hypothetical protein
VLHDPSGYRAERGSRVKYRLGSKVRSVLSFSLRSIISRSPLLVAGFERAIIVKNACSDVKRNTQQRFSRDRTIPGH